MEKIQTITYGLAELVDAAKMYVKGKDFVIERNNEDNRIIIFKGGILDTGTYFNSFSLEKWMKYTKLSSLKLCLEIKGTFILRIMNEWLTGGDFLKKSLAEEKYICEDTTLLEIDLSNFLKEKGIIYFEIVALTDTTVVQGGYCSDRDFKRKKIALAICTYKREKYIENIIEKYRLYAKHDWLGIFISDNGKSLSVEEQKNVYIFPNKNAGGASGFARCMLEISKYNDENKDEYEYMVLMDDDIQIDFNIFERLTSFISLLKNEYLTYFIAGSMCSLDYPFLQYEKYGSWRGNYFVQFGANERLDERECVIRNERIEYFKNQLIGWWFCCFATNLINDNNYPFPCFFRGDDMEFSVRNGGNVITLNGVCVWHEPFYKKYSIVSEFYYLIRNSMVINTLYMKDITRGKMIKYLLSKIKYNLLKYDYEAAELVIKAGEDFLKGPNFFANTDAEEYNQKLMQKNYKMFPLEKLCEEYKFSDIEYECYHKKDKNRIAMIIRRATINGFFVPKAFYKPFGFALIGYGAKNINFYKKRDVLNFDPFLKAGYICRVSKKRAIKIMLKFFKLSFNVYRYFEKIKQNYQINAEKLITKSFWIQYLDLQ